MSYTPPKSRPPNPVTPPPSGTALAIAEECKAPIRKRIHEIEMDKQKEKENQNMTMQLTSMLNLPGDMTELIQSNIPNNRYCITPGCFYYLFPGEKFKCAACLST